MRIAIGTDHRGLEFKKFVIKLLTEMGHSYQDYGAFSTEPVDYPDIAGEVCGAIMKKQCDRGILICGTGIGMSMAANKFRGIRAALCCDVFSATRAREHNDANVICLGAERGENGVKEMLEAFLNTPFEGGRHQPRLDKMRQIEELR
jgi:RpiB/LacA/LacB family sugar-phosphate isomerase